MKNFKSIERYINLDNISEDIKEKLYNLNGKEITECCCNSCCGTCCNTCCGDTCSDNPVPVNTCYCDFGKYYRYDQINDTLSINPTVQSIYELYYQFTKFNFINFIDGSSIKNPIEPIYFKCSVIPCPYEKTGKSSGKCLLSDNIQCNVKLYNTVKDICNTFELCCPIVYITSDNSIQIFTVKHLGTNGKENSIKSSLENIAKVLGKIENKSEVEWAQVLNVSIDNCDDLYDFLITFTINKETIC